MTNRRNIVKALKFHLREWDYEPREVKQNFHNKIGDYISWLVRTYSALSLRNS